MVQQVKLFESVTELLEDLDSNGITGIQKVRHVESFLMRKSRLHGRPYCATFELTPLCNFDCKMCYMHLTSEQMRLNGRMLTTEEWLDIARQAVDAGVTNVDLTGGECLTYSGFKEVYLYLISRGVHVSVLTNGQLISQEHVQLFTKYKPAVVQISLYGSSEEAYFNVTGKKAFQDVITAVKQLERAGIRVRMSVTPNRFMQDDASALLDLLHKMNVDYSIGTTTFPARPETGRDIANFIVDNEAYVRICKLETEYRKSLAERLSLESVKPYLYRIKGQETFEGAPCAAGTAHFHINWKGEMTPCIGFHAVTKSVIDSDLETAWKWIREQMMQYRPPQECQSCAFQNDCNGCAAEKSGGVLNGALNTWVCKRQKETKDSDMRLLGETDCV